MSPKTWRPLSLTTPLRSSPPLLIQPLFTANSYTVHLTDLTNIWSETLSKPQLLSRAASEETAIDPAQDSSQLKILLQKLEACLTEATDDTDVQLTSVPSRSGRSSLKLEIAQPLPAPLPKLVWTFVLKPLSAVQFTNLFVLPLLSIASDHRDQIESLMGIIRDKDNIIAKLSDCLEESKTDVKSVLGGGRARRRGLEKWEAGKWREEMNDGGGEKRVGQVVKDAFGEGEEEPGAVKGLGEEIDGWWKVVEEEEEEEEDAKPARRTKEERHESVREKVRVEERATKTPKREVKDETETEDEDDDFEIQKTPPPTQNRSPARLIPPNTKKTQSQDETASSDDGDGDLDLLPPTSRPHRSLSPSSPQPVIQKPKTKSGGIGKIGGSKSPRPSHGEPSSVKANPIGNTTTTTEDDDDDDPPPYTSRVIKNPFAPAAAAVATTTTAAADETDSDSDNAPAKKPTTTIKKKQIGKIGGVKKKSGRGGGINNDLEMKDYPATTTTTTTESSSSNLLNIHQSPPERSSSVSSSSQPPQPQHTAEEQKKAPSSEIVLLDEDEKADLKRSELEKELEAKRRKAPAKKRRKF